MKKKELIDRLAEKSGLYKYQARLFWDALIEILIEELKANGSITINKYGRFQLKNVEQHKSTNPFDEGKSMIVPEFTKIYFKPGSLLRKAFSHKERED